LPEYGSAERTADIARGVSRRSALRKGAAAAAAGAALMAHSAVADEANTASGFVGSWRITVTPDALATGETLGPALATFGADGTMTSAGSPVIIAPPPSPFPLLIASAGHGTWEGTGEHSAAFTFLGLLAEQGGTAHAVVTISGIGELDASGDTFAGEYSAKTVGQTGRTFAEGHGALSGTRIAVEPMSVPGATPTA
jgi:hypothetical protein